MRTIRAVALPALVMAFLGITGCKAPAPRSDALLVPTDRRADVVPEAAGKVKRERFVAVDTTRLSPPQNQRIELPLFGDTVIEAVGVRIEPAGKGFVWVGQVRNQPTSLVILSVQGDTLSGNVLTERGDNYEIRPLGRGVHVVRQLDPTTFLEDDVNTGPAFEKLAEQSPTADPCGGTDTGANIDVLFAYTATARAANGGTPGIEALIYGAVAATNQSYLNSGITQRMRIVHLREEAYTESGNSCTDLVRMQNATDTFLDGLITARDTHGADLVILIVNGALVSTSQFTGGARTGCAGPSAGVFGEAFNILNPNTSAFEPNALAVLTVASATANLTLAHEAGHLMGARHERLGDPTDGQPFNDNHGFFNNAAACLQRSVMTRIAPCSTCTRVPFWSNPATTRCSAAFGIALPAATAANNANALNTSAVNVANFRCSSPSRTDVWMRDTWDDTGAQPDPATASQPMWTSPYIWVRNSQDTTLVNQHAHETPALNSSVFAYVKLHNGSGGMASGNLELYWAHTSTGLAWPATWTLIGTAPVSGFAPSSTRVVELPWTTPASAPSAAGHFCLVARWVSPPDPIVGETADINANVRNSNNLVWRNLEPLGTAGDATSDAVFVVRNLASFGDKQRRGPVTLRIAPTAEEANGSFFFYGRGVLALDREVGDAWRKGGKKGHGFRELADGRLLITDPDGVVLENIMLAREGLVKLELERTAETPKRTFHVEATQLVSRSLVGGVTYELTPP